MKRVLFVTPEPPYPIAGGGQYRIASVYEYLAARYELHVIVFAEPGAGNPTLSCPCKRRDRCHVVGLRRHRKDAMSRFLRNSMRWIRGVPPLNDRYRGYEEWFLAFLTDKKFDRVVVEHFWLAGYVDLLAQHAEELVLDLHNLDSEFYSRQARISGPLGRLFFQRFSQLARELEHEWLPRYHRLLVPSSVMAERLHVYVDPAKVVVFPNALPDECLKERDVAEEELIVFSANFGYLPNVQGVEFFARQVWPRLRERFPQLRWRLVGKCPEKIRRIVAGDDRIELTGAVRDALDWIAPAKVAVVPIFSGSGTRLKILEAWAVSKAVISTRLGAEGLGAADGRHLMYADTAEEFIEKLSLLLHDTKMREELGSRGRELLQQKFTWKKAWQQLEEAGL